MQKLEHSYTTGTCEIIMATYVGLSSSLLIPYLAEFNAVQNLTLAGWAGRASKRNNKLQTQPGAPSCEAG